ncbi:hypothetical protein AcW1_001136 [Taiwanofungus camphoratus]|nr:hypothetical protein AcV7_001159 [Antrodia cinnamomea]KAI0964280.1 hypothetical protein AcW1_001136 [Antrodia cinnamomea]
MKRKLSLALTMITTVAFVLADERPCTAHDGDNYYNLSPLSSSKDYKFTSPSGQDFVVNVCRPVASDTWALKVDKPEDVAGFTRHERGDFSIGNVNTTLTIRNDHPVLIMTDGSRCPKADSMTASTAIRFVCDTSVFGAGRPELVAQLPQDDESACAFFIEWRTHIACPTHEKGGPWGFLAILAAILATAFMIYILVGTFYNRYVLELRGLDQIPRFSIFSFSETVAFLRGCVDRIKHRTSDSSRGDSGRWGNGRGGNDYRGLAEEEEAMMAGPPGFLDEQNEEDAHEQGAGGDVRPAGMDADGVVRL